MNAVAIENVKELKAKVRRLERQNNKLKVIRATTVENLEVAAAPVMLRGNSEFDRINELNKRLEQENFELNVQNRSLERENANYLKIIDKACRG
jgi:hypothetical protein